MAFSSSLLATFAAASCIALLIFFTMGLFGGGNQMPVDGKTVLITGASEGTGVCVAEQLAAKGANVIIVARNEEKLQNTVRRMQAAAKNPSGQRFHYITADVSVPDYADGLVQEAIKWNGGKALDVVWAIAGFSVPQLLLDMDIQSMRNQMNVNYYGAVELALAICRVWLAPNAPVEDEPKHLILTISAAIFSPVAGYGPYAPSKAALRIFAEHLSSEVDLYPQNVKVHVCVPGSIQSEGMTRENTTKPDLTLWLEETDPMQSPEDSARAFIQGLEKGHYFLTSNWLTQIMIWGGLQNSRRNYNFIFDLFGVILTYFVWLYFRIELASKGKQYAKKHGHPATWIKKSSS